MFEFVALDRQTQSTGDGEKTVVKVHFSSSGPFKFGKTFNKRIGSRYRATGRQSNTKIHVDTGTSNKCQTFKKKERKKKLWFPANYRSDQGNLEGFRLGSTLELGLTLPLMEIRGREKQKSVVKLKVQTIADLMKQKRYFSLKAVVTPRIKGEGSLSSSA